MAKNAKKFNLQTIGVDVLDDPLQRQTNFFKLPAKSQFITLCSHKLVGAVIGRLRSNFDLSGCWFVLHARSFGRFTPSRMRAQVPSNASVQAWVLCKCRFRASFSRNVAPRSFATLEDDAKASAQRPKNLARQINKEVLPFYFKLPYKSQFSVNCYPKSVGAHRVRPHFKF